MPTRPAARQYRTWISDSRRWNEYRPRPGDVVIATYPKCGTTWMQQIVSLLIFQSSEPRPIGEIGAWVDRRLDPIEAVMARFEAQSHRRFLKCHIPYDGMPIHSEVRYIHVARDGRDTCLSFHNQVSRFRGETLRQLDAAGLGDETIGRPFPKIPADPRVFFHMWLREGVGGAEDGSPQLSYFDFEATYWSARQEPNLLLVHYRDLKADLEGEMRRVAAFLEIAIPDVVWPSLVEAASFTEMRRHGAALMPRVMKMFSGGPADFFQKGENDRWRGVLDEEDLAAYERKVAMRLSASCGRWLRHGRLATNDPREVCD